jgi:hypothetical protein
MAAPTSAVQKLKKTLANGKPSTHSAKQNVWFVSFAVGQLARLKSSKP